MKNKTKSRAPVAMNQLQTSLNVAERKIVHLNKENLTLQHKCSVLSDECSKLRLQMQQLQFQLAKLGAPNIT